MSPFCLRCCSEMFPALAITPDLQLSSPSHCYSHPWIFLFVFKITSTDCIFKKCCSLIRTIMNIKQHYVQKNSFILMFYVFPIICVFYLLITWNRVLVLRPHTTPQWQTLIEEDNERALSYLVNRPTVSRSILTSAYCHSFTPINADTTHLIILIFN